MKAHLYLCLWSVMLLSRSLAQQQDSMYINCGGDDFTDSRGIVWQSDDGFYTTGDSTRTFEDIDNTSIPYLYQSKRWIGQGPLTYNIPLANGEYYILLHFSETQSSVAGEGQRLFNVYMEDVRVLSEVDVYKEAGKKRAAVILETAAVVRDEELSIILEPILLNPIISGIEIHPLPPQTQEESMPFWIDMKENENYTGRHECSFVQAGDKFYLFGGRENAIKLEIYDYSSNTWSIGAPLPQAFNHFQATQYQGLIWVVGAFADNGFPQEPPATYVYVYDPARNIWMEGPAIPRPRGSSGVAVYNDKFYVVGGNTNGHSGGYVAWTDEYNPVTGQWRELQDAPHARDHFHAVVISDKLYAAGGRQTQGGDWFANVIPEVDVYDLKNDKWLVSNDTLPNDLPVPRAGTATVVFENKVVVMGGESPSQETAHRQVHALNPTTGKWQKLAPLNYGRHGTQAIVSGNGIFVTAGSPKRGGGNQKNMEVYNENDPQGIPSVPGFLTSSSVDIQTQGVVKIRHDAAGNQGVLVTSMSLVGPDFNDFEVFESPTTPFLVPFNSSVNVVIRNKNGNTTEATAWLYLIYSGREWLSVPLADETSSIGTSLDLRIQGLILVDTVSGRDIDSVHHCNGCIISSQEISIRAECSSESHVDRVIMTLTSTNGITRRTERTPPFTLFGDNYGQYLGRQLPVGRYTVTAQAIGVNGESGALKTATLIVIE